MNLPTHPPTYAWRSPLTHRPDLPPYLPYTPLTTLGATWQVRRWSCLIDLSGIGFSARLPLLLWSGRPVLRTPPSESGMWSFIDDATHFAPDEPLLPYVHYVPVANDLSDLVEQARWVQEHPREAAGIGTAAQAWARRHLTRERAEDYLVESLVAVAAEA